MGNSDCLEGAGFHDQRMMMGEGHMGGLGVPGAGNTWRSQDEDVEVNFCSNTMNEAHKRD